ncbi:MULTISPECIES: hypothetical protein [Paenibacillus]|uniref:MFS transporter n=1 Tax=Paenibacillus polymyxa (strain SC2) TaxID=886882 RepID=E3EI13_PAEPS|nr:MFS transporter [Paenibacillus polymyxa SC2]MBU9709740.1 MFS transporter [Paenibacillus sp. AK121]CCC85303.1 uncharacterized MFS-type transporter YddS [Paenibacillus polymyxa M1]
MVETIPENKQTSVQIPPSIMEYMESPLKHLQLHARTMKVVVASQICGGAGLAAGIP